ncbi:MAG: extracellular solute-binding protein [Gemmatimonadetes bacterium]|nr:extracellular solute-binding protein [Gemmatimonadota bacterium]
MRAQCFTLAAIAFLLGCGGAERAGGERVLVVFNAGSLARPIRAALDTFAAREGVRVEQESAGSLETARKLTELGKVPDVVALADAEVFPRYLMPAQVDGYVEFARNRMVLAYTDRSRFAAEMAPDTWWRILLRPGVETGRSDPQLDPNGYRSMLVWQLAERHYGEPGLASRLEAASPSRNVRPKEADLIGLLQAGEFDYIWSYESIARAIGLRYVLLSEAVDLSTPDSAAAYALAVTTVRGARAGDSVTFRGAPIVYAFAVPIGAPHAELAARFAAFLLSDAGRVILQREGLDAVDAPIARGTRAPWMPAPPDTTSVGARKPR